MINTTVAILTTWLNPFFFFIFFILSIKFKFIDLFVKKYTIGLQSS